MNAFVVESNSLVRFLTEIARSYGAALTNYYLGFKAYILAQIFVTCALQITNIASIIVVAQVFDETIIYYFNRTGAIQFYPTFGWEWYPST